MNPYYQDETITLYCADLFDIIPSLPRADAVITDPPYAETHLDWDVWPDGWPGLVSGITDQLWCFGSMRMFLDRSREFSDWKFAQDVVWEKNNGSNPAKDRFKRVHELALHFYRGKWGDLYRNTPELKGVASHAKVMGRGRMNQWGAIEQKAYVSDGSRLMSSVIFAQNCNGYAVNETQKPEAVVSPLVEFSVPKGGLVIDPFAGSGTTLAVARKLGCRAIGIEKRESQCEEIVKRLSQRDLFAGCG